MSVMSVLEFERATAIVTFDMPVSNGNPIHIAFNGGSYELLMKKTQFCIWNETGHHDVHFAIINFFSWAQYKQLSDSHTSGANEIPFNQINVLKCGIRLI